MPWKHSWSCIGDDRVLFPVPCTFVKMTCCLQADRKVQSSEGRAMAEELKMLFFEAPRNQLTMEGRLWKSSFRCRQALASLTWWMLFSIALLKAGGWHEKHVGLVSPVPWGLSADPKAESDDEIVLEPQRQREATDQNIFAAIGGCCVLLKAPDAFFHPATGSAQTEEVLLMLNRTRRFRSEQVPKRMLKYNKSDKIPLVHRQMWPGLANFGLPKETTKWQGRSKRSAPCSQFIAHTGHLPHVVWWVHGDGYMRPHNKFELWL